MSENFSKGKKLNVINLHDSTFWQTPRLAWCRIVLQSQGLPNHALRSPAGPWEDLQGAGGWGEVGPGVEVEVEWPGLTAGRSECRNVPPLQALLLSFALASTWDFIWKKESGTLNAPTFPLELALTLSPGHPQQDWDPAACSRNLLLSRLTC